MWWFLNSTDSVNICSGVLFSDFTQQTKNITAARKGHINKPDMQKSWIFSKEMSKKWVSKQKVRKDTTLNLKNQKKLFCNKLANTKETGNNENSVMKCVQAWQNSSEHAGRNKNNDYLILNSLMYSLQYHPSSLHWLLVHFRVDFKIPFPSLNVLSGPALLWSAPLPLRDSARASSNQMSLNVDEI